MFKRIAKKIFRKYYKLDCQRNYPSDHYNKCGMVIPQKRNVRYIASPLVLNEECIIKSIEKYGISLHDSAEEALKKAFEYHCK